ncbi:MAG: hypothetical protein AB1486_23370 [Planctomycetota bacterium]
MMRRSHKALLLVWGAALGISVAAGWWLIGEGPQPEPDGAGRVGVPQPAVTDARLRGRAPDKDTSPGEGPSEVRAPAITRTLLGEGASEPALAGATVPGGRPALRGTITVVDALGQEHRDQDGFLDLCDGTALRRTFRIGVHEGHWELERPDRRLHVLRAELGGRPADVEGRPLIEARDPGRGPAPGGGLLELRATWRRALSLHVLGADTRCELPDVVVVDGTARRSKGCVIVEGDEVVAARGESPVGLPESSARREYLVCANGYACKSIVVSFVDPRPRYLILERGGDLEIVLRGLPPKATGELRLSRDGVGVASTRPKRSLSMRGLLPGLHEVQLDLGASWAGRVVGTTQAQVEAGKTARVELTLDEEPRSTGTALLCGTLFIPSAWKVTTFYLDIMHDGGSRSSRPRARIITSWDMSGGPNLFAWNAGQMVLGRYLLRMGYPQWTAPVDVGPGGATVDIRLPEPAEVHVRFRDARTGEAVRPSGIAWQALALDLAVPRLAGRMSAHIMKEEYSFLAPIGQVEITCPQQSQAYKAFAKVVDVGPGSNDFTFELEAILGIRVELLQGKDPVLMDGCYVVAVRRLDGPGGVVSVEDQETYRLHHVSDPGRYEVAVALRHFLGLATPAPVVVEVVPGEPAQVRIEL